VTKAVDQPHETELVSAARGGDEKAFGSLVEVRRGELHAHCYRMLASLDDADDAVQETLLRAWKSLASFEGRSSVRTWLFRIATNVALDIVSRRSRRELPVSFGPPSAFGESLVSPVTDISWMAPYPGPYARTAHGIADENADLDQPESRFAAHETIELAYVAALQHLSAHQRAVFVLREALDFSAAETAEILDTTVAAVNSALQRARAQIKDRLPSVSQAVELSRVGDAAVRELATRYARAIEQADLDSLLGLLTEDASWSMPPLGTWFRGERDVGNFLRNDVLPRRWLHRTCWANGQLAIGCYLFDPGSDRFEAAALDVLELRDGRIAAVTGFLTPVATGADPDSGPVSLRSFVRFGLPEHLFR
jgi:RNA polymerase sigma-70 factor, ECF subfamily